MASSTYGTSLEQTIPVVQELGLNTTKNINFDSGSNSCALPASTTIGGSAVVALANITSNATTGVVFSITGTGVYTGTGAVVTTFDSATTGTVESISANGLTTGHALVVTSSGVIVTTGDLLAVTASGATTSTGVVRVTTAALTTGSAVTVVANALTSGSALTVTSSSTDTTAHGLVTLTNSGTGSIASLIKGTNAAISTHFFKFATVNSVTIWIGDGTTANSALSGTAGDLLINGGSNKPEYCTGTTNWTALV